MEIKDVEELVSVGEEVEACPYYGSRYAVPKAEVCNTSNIHKIRVSELVVIFHCVIHTFCLKWSMLKSDFYTSWNCLKELG